MIDFLKNNLFITLLGVMALGLFLYDKVYKIKKDSEKQYSIDDIKGWIYLEEGKKYFLIPYDRFTEKNKFRFIIDNYKQRSEIVNENGDKFLISSLVNKEYIKEDIDKFGNKSRSGPYVVYELLSEVEISKGDTHFKNNGPVQIIGPNSYGEMNIESSDFSKIINEYKAEIINSGVSEKDLNVYLSNKSDPHVKESFLSKYGVELAGIAINVSGTVISLLSYLKQ